MRQTGQCAIARYSARGKQSLVLVRPLDNALVLQYLHYSEEMRSVADVPVGTAEVKPQELQLAMQFVNQLATDDFHPEKYEDAVRKRTLELIQKKVEGEPIQAAPTEAPTGQIIDLMEALKASLGQRPPAAPVAVAVPVAAATPATVEASPAAPERKPPKRSPRAPKSPDVAAGDDSAAPHGK
jgi:DNA end-binding protein Ku